MWRGDQPRPFPRSILLVAAFSALGELGCESNWTVTPLPQPPAIDGDRIHVSSITAGGGVTLSGEARSATPGATLRALNLETTDDAATATIASNGSFELELSGSEGDEVRVDVLEREERSDPIDYRLQEPLATSPRHECVVLLPAFSLKFERSPGSELLMVENRCDEEVTIDHPRTRLGLPDFESSSELPQTLAPGAATALELSFVEQSADAREDVFFVDLALEGVAIRYPITLFAPENR